MANIPFQKADEDGEFFELAKRFRAAEDPEEIKRLGDELGRMIFGESSDEERGAKN